MPTAALNVQNRAAGLLPSWLGPFPPLCSFPVAKSTQLICVEIHIVQSFQGPGRGSGQVGAVPSSGPGPELCQEGTQISGGGREPHLPSQSVEAMTKGPLWNVGLGMDAGVLAVRQGPAGSSLLALRPPGCPRDSGRWPGWREWSAGPSQSPHCGQCSQHSYPEFTPAPGALPRDQPLSPPSGP